MTGTMGIRKKITIAFASLAGLLFFSGVVSLLELNKLSRRTQELLQLSSSNMELSKRMLDAAEMQNGNLLQMIILGGDRFDSVYIAARADFEIALEQAAAHEEINRGDVQAVAKAWEGYYGLVGSLFDEGEVTDVEWFLDMYQNSYNRLTSSIKEMMLNSQVQLMGRAESLEGNAYRAITPGIISLAVALILIIVFAFMIDFYYTRPLARISKGLDNYLRHRIPFNVDVEGDDELTSLRDNISRLTATARNRIYRF